jgi:hypothetical protein
MTPVFLLGGVLALAFAAVLGWLGYRRYLHPHRAFWLIVFWLVALAAVNVLRSSLSEQAREVDRRNSLPSRTR